MVRFVVLLVLIVPEISAQNPAVSTSDLAVDIGGLKQWISIRRNKQRNPVLLFLHGGPGNSVMSYADNFTSELQKQFVVVQWDQRESGKTAELNASEKPLTVALMESDAVEMIHYLRVPLFTGQDLSNGSLMGWFSGIDGSVAPSRTPSCLCGRLSNGESVGK